MRSRAVDQNHEQNTNKEGNNMSEAAADSYEEGIFQAWIGELQGEMFFDAMAQSTVGVDRGRREKWETLAELERVTGRRMAKLLEAKGIEPAAPAPSGQLLDALAAYTKMPFAEAVSAMRPILLPAIDRFEALLTQAPAADRQAVQFLVDHERAILSFVELEEAGETDASLDAARALIHQSAAQ